MHIRRFAQTPVCAWPYFVNQGLLVCILLHALELSQSGPVQGWHSIGQTILVVVGVGVGRWGAHGCSVKFGGRGGGCPAAGSGGGGTRHRSSGSMLLHWVVHKHWNWVGPATWPAALPACHKWCPASAVRWDEPSGVEEQSTGRLLRPMEHQPPPSRVPPPPLQQYPFTGCEHEPHTSCTAQRP